MQNFSKKQLKTLHQIHDACGKKSYTAKTKKYNNTEKITQNTNSTITKNTNSCSNLKWSDENFKNSFDIYHVKAYNY